MAAAQVEFRTRLSTGGATGCAKASGPTSTDHRHRERGPRPLRQHRQCVADRRRSGRVPTNKLPSLDLWKADLGVGVDVGFIAAYLAKSVTNGEPIKFSVRLQRRF
jgi:hypothetical protein